MRIRRRALALFLALVLTVSGLIGNTNFSGLTTIFAASDNLVKNLRLEQSGNGFKIQWDRYNDENNYDIYRGESRYGTYHFVTSVEGTTWTDANPNAVKYENYYKVARHGSETLSEPISLEMEMFGNGMYIFSPKDDINQVYNTINDAFLYQGDVDAEGTSHAGQQFGERRYAFAFKKGDYSNISANEMKMAYYMQVLGLGKLPTDVKLKNIHVPPVLDNANVTCNFWMGIENVSIAPVGFETNDAYWDFQWAVSQAAPARRLYVDRGMRLNYMWDGWASGGYVADSWIEGNLGSWSQQQYYLRNNYVKGDFYGINWNMVAQGCTGIQGNEWNKTTTKYPMYDLQSGLGRTNWQSGGKYTVLNETDALREKPFLFFDEDEKEYKVFKPALRRNSSGISWSKTDMGEGTILDIDDFYIARADRDNAASINAALDAGKHIILSPGIYHAEEPIHIKKANTIVLGLGLATIIPDNPETGVMIDDVDGVTVAGIILDADSYSKNMIVAGSQKTSKRHSSNPTILQDVFVRIGGVHGGVASTKDAVVINSNDVIGDHFWIWRADHGAGVGWNLNTTDNGVVVNGDYVTLYGLMVEHFQKYDVLWRGEYGTTYFLQNEKCYDPQEQEKWMSHEGTANGYAAYKVANSVENHYAVGLGSYDVFINTGGASIFLDNAVEVPDAPGVMLENICTVEIANGSGPIVGFNNIINSTGPAITTGTGSGGGYARQAVLLYNNKQSKSLHDYYENGTNDGGVVVQEEGITPTFDPVADDPSYSGITPDPEPEPIYIAEGPYAEWKNNGLLTPKKGQLVAAGIIDVEFSKLDNATEYEVYVDEQLVDTVAASNKETYQAKFESVNVNEHKLYVLAKLPDGSKIKTNQRTFYISKKGMGIWQSDVDKISELNLSWYYTWGTEPLQNAPENVEFIPMLWGNFGENSKEMRWINNEEYKKYNYVLTFNEPDVADQANMTPQRTVELWQQVKKIQAAGVKVSSPSTSTPTVLLTDTNNAYGTVGGWYSVYDQLMVQAEEHDDFVAVHFYFDWPGDFILGILDDLHERTGKPIWITEWGVGQWTQSQDFDWTGGPDEGNWQRNMIVDFVNNILPRLDKIDYIERYAWFPFDGSNTEKFGNGASGLFFCGNDDPKKGQLTSVGKAYAKSGNPKGYKADADVKDIVLEDEMGNDEVTTAEQTTGETTTEEVTTEATTVEETTTEEVTTKEEVTTQEQHPIVVSKDTSVLGYQVSTTLTDAKGRKGGVRVIASAEPTINGKQVTSYGLVYSLTEFNGKTFDVSESDMYVGSDNYFVADYESQNGDLDIQAGQSSTASYYAMTMTFGGSSAAALSAKYKVRSYALLEDGTYVYSNVKTYSIYSVSDFLYKNVKMSTEAAHNFLFTNVLSVVNKDYDKVDFFWGNELIKPQNLQ